MRPNKTPWVDKAVKKFEGALAAVAPEQAMPFSEESGGLKEFGCGHYGCVMPTEQPELVFKLTTDIAEAAFVRAALHLGDFPPGMIRYYSVYQLAGLQHRKRPLFALWRQEATEVGNAVMYSEWMRADNYEKRLRREGSTLLANAKWGAGDFRDWLQKNHPYESVQKWEDWAWDVVANNTEVLERSPMGPEYVKVLRLPELLKRFRGAQRAAVGLRVFDACVELMESNALVYTIGQAMRFYREHAIVLADVHANNVGLATHEDFDKPIVTITDPGHAVFLDHRFDDLTIEELTS